MTTPRLPLVLILAGNAPTRRTTASCLMTFGFEVLTAAEGAEAARLLAAERRIAVIIVDADLAGEVSGLTAARMARDLNPKMSVIYTARLPHMIPESRKVRGAPSLRTPYYAPQLVGLIGELRAQRSTSTPDRQAA
jgi:CheY-like chemotaxis protein